MPYVTSFERLAKEEGREVGLKQGIQTALELRFGGEGLGLMSEINQISQVDVLEKILRAIKTANSPQALRDQWQSNS